MFSVQDRLNNFSLAFKSKSALDHKVYWMLVLACAWCFIGHGAWGIVQKSEWLTFFRPFGFPDDVSYLIMPLIGVVDIAMGIIILFWPTRALLLWMAIWCLWTAFLRPIAGLGFWEVFERGGNFGPPIAFLAWVGWGKGKYWFAGIYEKDAILTEKSARLLYWILALSIGFFLIGHGAFQALQNKEMLLLHWAAIGMPPGSIDPVQFMMAIGWFEIVLGFWVILKPNPQLLVFIVGWKVLTELLYPISGPMLDTWEFIERGGDYFAPLALIFVIAWLKANTDIVASAPSRSPNWLAALTDPK